MTECVCCGSSDVSYISVVVKVVPDCLRIARVVRVEDVGGLKVPGQQGAIQI